MRSNSYLRTSGQKSDPAIRSGNLVTSTEYLITFPLSETVSAHAPCHVTSNWGQK